MRGGADKPSRKGRGLTLSTGAITTYALIVRSTALSVFDFALASPGNTLSLRCEVGPTASTITVCVLVASVAVVVLDAWLAHI